MNIPKRIKNRVLLEPRRLECLRELWLEAAEIDWEKSTRTVEEWATRTVALYRKDFPRVPHTPGSNSMQVVTFKLVTGAEFAEMWAHPETWSPFVDEVAISRALHDPSISVFENLSNLEWFTLIDTWAAMKDPFEADLMRHYRIQAMFPEDRNNVREERDANLKLVTQESLLKAVKAGEVNIPEPGVRACMALYEMGVLAQVQRAIGTIRSGKTR